MKIVLLAALTVLSASPVLLSAGEIKGAGSGSCGEWVEERKTNTYYATLHWLQGFISAYNQYVYRGKNPNGVFGNADHKAIAAWMDNYCKANPLNSPYVGAVLLIDELEARAD